jgi:hypothetical protein
MSNNKENVRIAFDKVCLAIATLEGVKTKLADLHYVAEEVEISEEMINRVSMKDEPSADTHEAVYLRSIRAKDRLRERLTPEFKDELSSQLGVAYVATSDAFTNVRNV